MVKCRRRGRPRHGRYRNAALAGAYVSTGIVGHSGIVWGWFGQEGHWLPGSLKDGRVFDKAGHSCR